MENVLAAIIIIFIILFAVLTLSNAFIAAQDTLSVSWQEMQDRQDIASRTELQAVEANTSQHGALINFTLQNAGAEKLADFENWDVIVEYEDGAIPPAKHVVWLPYAENNLADNQWTVLGLYQRAEQDIPEGIEPGVFNPGEDLIVQARVNLPVGVGSPVQIFLATEAGSGSALVFSGNIPPELVTNQPITLAAGKSTDLNKAVLETTDADDTPENLVYIVTTPPANGSLNRETPFTQTEVNERLVSYSHNGGGADSFGFTVSDGKDTIGVYTFTVNISQPPEVPTNTGLNLALGGQGAIGDELLKATDPDDAAEALVFTVTQSPTMGQLSLPETFTQADINGGQLFYTSTGSEAANDSFAFTVSDGETSVGPYTFGIAIH
ncbi:MAG TPA: cadherin-like domain-containing protein [Phototrophicaceae bacterium]|nr:cadherin-like domain-containing protein [Phototrophicaceae bacterium]